jgi:hypothetical protein
MSEVELAVNGTLMSGLELNDNLVDAGAELIHTTTTSPEYRLFSINDQYPAMIRSDRGASIEVEVWRLSADALVSILANEPPGLTIGRASLADGSMTLAVLGEPWICEAAKEITEFGGWRSYIARRDA